MKIGLEGIWQLILEDDAGGWQEEVQITLPGTLQAAGYGADVSCETEWVSGLHDNRWYLREEYKYGVETGSVKVPFLSQPAKIYNGAAWYERWIEFSADFPGGVFRIEAARQKSCLWIDGHYIGEDFSLCAAHEIACPFIPAGNHVIRVCIDNRMQYPYRPDGHGVSDALGANWNGMLGEISFLSDDELELEWICKQQYAAAFPRDVKVRDGAFFVDGDMEYFRGTHFGGEYPLTGHPVMSDVGDGFWPRLMETVKEWGLNFIRCHSLCLPEAAFAAADRAGVYLQIECGMWNVFEEGIPMLDILQKETRKILRQFGHHPSFVLFSPTNEPAGSWYEPLRRWVSETRAYDAFLGYAGRRLYTAQSGWFYDTTPKDITGTDYIYFHRSGHGPFLGGNIRNHQGWKGNDYRTSLTDVRLPVICHELGQWCVYPDFAIKEKFTGFIQPGNYEIFEASAKRHGVLPYNRLFAQCSGKNQVLMYKEELEANFRTPSMYGFELLDLHDYLGQGTAVVGVLDAFWEEKGYINAGQWRQFCGETVLLARFSSYTWKQGDIAEVPLEICHFGKVPLSAAAVDWKLELGTVESGRKILSQGQLFLSQYPQAQSFGKNLSLGCVSLDFSAVRDSSQAVFTLTAGGIQNHWDLTILAETKHTGKALYTHDWQAALHSLDAGGTVIFAPYLSELSYDCPPASMRPVFWNAQMGPGWGRSLGLVCKEGHPLWNYFPTKPWGGWLWEEILDRSRGFHMAGLMEQTTSVVSVIDDWNRNLPLSLLFEAKVAGRKGTGKLLVVTADLSGDFAGNPAAWCLKQALIAYADTDAFAPDTYLDETGLAEITTRFMPNHLWASLRPVVTAGEGSALEQADALTDGNPNTSVQLHGSSYPLSVNLQWQRPLACQKAVIMTGQKDRLRKGDPREYELYGDCGNGWFLLQSGTLVSTWEQQVIEWNEVYPITGLKLNIRSGFDQPDMVWKQRFDGWYREPVKERKAYAELAIFTPVPAAGESMFWQPDNQIYWNREVKSTTREIDD